MELQFKSDSPCNNCPYRKDAPLRIWHKSEYEKLLKSETDNWGCVYGCHKDNGSVCVGWLMNQRQRNYPSLALRLKMITQKISSTFLDTLHCVSEMYGSVQEMIIANYPEQIQKHTSMAYKIKKGRGGFGSMSPERQHEIQKMGNAARQKTLAKRKK